jgi:hypothetical protein
MEEEFEIRLRAKPGQWNSPPVRRLAIILKRLLRNYGFQCIRARAIPMQDDGKQSESGVRQILL